MEVQISYSGSSAGIDNVVGVDITGIGTEHVEGYIEYDVLDHCQPSATVSITGFGYGFSWCYFGIILTNAPPVTDLPDTLLAYYDQSFSWPVFAEDPDGDPVEGIVLDAYWFLEDSLHSPANAPSFDGGNPGVLSWIPGLSDLGTWVFSFVSADECCADTNDNG